MKKLLMILAMLAFGLSTAFAGSISGKITAKDTGKPLAGANVYLEGTTVGAASDSDGMYYIKISDGTYNLICDYVGFAIKEVAVEIEGDITKDFELTENLFAKTINIVANRAVDRQTPVAFTNVEAEQLETQLASRDVPMVLNTIPGVYATETGGGYGDARINVRGFDQRNTAVMINGVPVNDMENGWVYWSNWAGMGDVTSSVQIQRGLGSSLFSTPSIGGTINIVTRSLDLKPMVKVKQEIGSYDFQKTSAIYSSGLTENNFAFTALVSRTTADGYADATYLDAFSYFFDVGYLVGDHAFELTVVGAPQKHGQRYSKSTINEYQTRGLTYNPNWGYLHGEALNWRENFYHKPVANLNWNWQIKNNMSLSTIGYVSVGTGGGTGDYSSRKGALGKYWPNLTAEGLTPYDEIYEYNSSSIDSAYSTTENRSHYIIRASMNNHFWSGLISTIKYDMENMTLNFGIDGRYYVGEHYRTVENLLGGDYFINSYNKNRDPNALLRVGDKIAYYNDGVVRYFGAFGQAEYRKDNLSTFANLSLNQTGYERIDYFNFLDSDPDQSTGFQNFLGYTVKAGANYNINQNLNVFVNGGYISKAPGFDNVFHYNNDLYKDVENETIMAVEGGIGYATDWFAINLNGYHTQWANKSIQTSVEDTAGVEYYYNVSGLGALHQGVELDARVIANENLEFNAAIAYAYNRWTNDVSSIVALESDPTQTKKVDTYVKNVKVGDAPMTQVALDLTYRVAHGKRANFYFNPQYIYFSRLFAQFDPEDRGDGDPQPWRLPDYGVLNFHIGYNFRFTDSIVDKMSISLNLFNALDREYITDADDGYDHKSYDAKVYYGRGRNMNCGISFVF